MDISLDWKKQNKAKKAIIFSYAEGIASYSGINEYFIGGLVSKGACKRPDYVMGLHWLDLNQKYVGIYSKNDFISNKLNYYVSKDGQKLEFSVSRVADLNEKNKKALLKMIRNCQKEKIW